MTAVVLSRAAPFNHPLSGAAYETEILRGYRGSSRSSRPIPAFPDRTPLEALAGQQPSLDLQFANQLSLIDRISGQQLVTFTRASNGTYTDSAGVLQTAATDVPRFDHDPTTGESLGLLVEEQRTNLLLQE